MPVSKQYKEYFHALMSSWTAHILWWAIAGLGLMALLSGCERIPSVLHPTNTPIYKDFAYESV